MKNLSSWNFLHLVVSWVSVGTDPHDFHLALITGLTGPGTLEKLPLVLVFNRRTPGIPQISINWGDFVKSHSRFPLSSFLSLSPPPSLPPTLSLFPSPACWHVLETSSFYALPPFLPKFIQCVFWLFHLPLKASWRSECSEPFLFLRHPV